jgi:hypothetical protein
MFANENKNSRLKSITKNTAEAASQIKKNKSTKLCAFSSLFIYFALLFVILLSCFVWIIVRNYCFK